MNNQITDLYKDELTQQGIDELKAKYPAELVLDMSMPQVMKDARKTRTERNKLIAAIDRRRIDTSAQIKSVGDDLIQQITEIFDVVVVPFEAEDKRLKAIAEEARLAEAKLVAEDQEKLARLWGFIDNSEQLKSAGVSANIDALSNIDVSEFRKELIHEAIETKEKVLSKLTDLLQQKLNSEALDAERAEMDRERAQMDRERAEMAKLKAEMAEMTSPPEPVLKKAIIGESVDATLLIEISGSKSYILKVAEKIGLELGGLLSVNVIWK